LELTLKEDKVPKLCQILLKSRGDTTVTFPSISAGALGDAPERDIVVRDELILGRRDLTARFHTSPSHTVGAKEPLESAASSYAIYHLIAGWACRVRNFPDGHQAIVDVYLPGDVIGLDWMLPSRAGAEVMTLTSVSTKVIDTARELGDLMSRRSTALYVAWLLARRQRRSDRFLAAISSLDARGRVATMMIDFYNRLKHQRLITAWTYNLPLTQNQIGAYLGLTVAHVNRVLRLFRDEQIAVLERHCLTILDLQSLARLAQSNTTARSPADLEKRLVDEPLSLQAQPTRNDVISDPGDRPCATAFGLFSARASSGDDTARHGGKDNTLAIPLPH
jgi:CRP-like cAMP-binding protein